MLKKFSVLIILVLVAYNLAAQDSVSGQWKQAYASPTYGLAILPITIEGENEGFEDTLFMPAIDLRISTGINAAKRGGFYTGVEVGTILLIPGGPGSATSFSDTYTDEASNSYSYDVAIDCGTGIVYLLSKYGYRLDIGISVVGMSVGAELGIGARLASGGIDLSTTVDEAYGSFGIWETNTMFIDVLIDTAVEATVRLGTNFRLFARVGAMLTPPIFDGEDNSFFWDNAGDLRGADGDNAGWGESDVEALLSRYDIEASFIMPTARLGFILYY